MNWTWFSNWSNWKIFHPKTRKTSIYLFAQLKCKMRLQIVRNWNANLFSMYGRFFNSFNLKIIFNSFSLLDVALGHALAAVTHSTLVNFFEFNTEYMKVVDFKWTDVFHEWMIFQLLRFENHLKPCVLLEQCYLKGGLIKMSWNFFLLKWIFL